MYSQKPFFFERIKAMLDTHTPKPPKRSLWKYLWIALALIILVGGYFLSQFEKEFTLTETDAQTLIDTQVAKYLAENPDVTIEYFTVDFAENSMTIDAAGGKEFAVPRYGPQLVTAALDLTGDPDFRNPSVYINPEGDDAFNFTELAINGEDPLEVAKRFITAAATETPLIRDNLLTDDRVQGGLDWLRDKAGVNVEVDETINNAAINTIEVAANEFVEAYREPAEVFMENLVVDLLERTPLYTLGKNGDWREMAARAALSDIGIENGVFTATLSGMKLLITIGMIVGFLGFMVGWVIAVRRDKTGWTGDLAAIFHAWS